MYNNVKTRMPIPLNNKLDYYVLIAGSRTITNAGVIENFIREDLNRLDIKDDKYNIIIVTGGASGVDTIAEHFADKNNYGKIIMYAEWGKYGNSAGFIRNEQMHKYISKKNHRIVLCFKDKYSTGMGTTHSIELGKKYKNNVIFHTIDFEEMIDHVDKYNNE